MGIGALGGVAAGFAFPVDPLDCGPSSTSFCSRGEAIFSGSAIFGGAGAGVGAFLKRDRWVTIPGSLTPTALPAATEGPRVRAQQPDTVRLMRMLADEELVPGDWVSVRLTDRSRFEGLLLEVSSDSLVVRPNPGRGTAASIRVLPFGDIRSIEEGEVELGPDAKVVVTMNDGTRIKGRLRQVSAESLVVRQGATAGAVPPDRVLPVRDVQTIRSGAMPGWMKALIWVGPTVGFGVWFMLSYGGV
jgi:hypothetical protein